MAKTWSIIVQDTRDGPVAARWVEKFPREDKETGEVSFLPMKWPILRCLIDNDPDGRSPLAVQWSRPRGWHIRFPQRVEQRLQYVRGGTRRDYWDAPSTTVTPVQEFASVEALRDALVRRCGPQLTQDVLGEMMAQVNAQGD